MELSIIVPAYNEEKGIARILPLLERYAVEKGWEIIIVDDGSTDRTAEVVKSHPHVRLVSQANVGNGGALKRGFREAKGEYVLTLDADGQHRPEDIPALFEAARGHDFTTGVRTADSNRPTIRKPGKWLLTLAAEIISGKKILDINCGFRVYRRETVLPMIPLFPNGFSQATTSMIAYLKGGYDVAYHPIRVEPRMGRSSNVRIVRDGLKTLFIILRVSALYDPWVIFKPFSILFLLASFAIGMSEVWLMGATLPRFGLLSLLLTGVVFLMGFLADMVSSLKQSQPKR